MKELIAALRIVGHPLLDALHAGLGQAEFALLHKPASYRAIGVPVLIRIGQSQQRAIFQNDSARALHLEKEGLGGVFHIDNLQALVAQQALLLQFAAGGVGHHRDLAIGIAKLLAFPLVITQLWVPAIVGHRHQISWRAVERHSEPSRWGS